MLGGRIASLVGSRVPQAMRSGFGSVADDIALKRAAQDVVGARLQRDLADVPFDPGDMAGAFRAQNMNRAAAQEMGDFGQTLNNQRRAYVDSLGQGDRIQYGIGRGAAQAREAVGGAMNAMGGPMNVAFMAPMMIPMAGMAVDAVSAPFRGSPTPEQELLMRQRGY